MSNTYFNPVCWVDDTVLIAVPEDTLQRLLHSFNQSAKGLNMIINTDKSKCLATSKELVRYRLEVDERMIEQVNHFKYLRAIITSSGNLDSEVRKQTMKASQISDCLRNIVWRNKYLKMEKVRIYKSAVRLVMTYAAITRPNTSKIQQMMRTVESEAKTYDNKGKYKTWENG
ncbi:putative Si dkeyp-35f12.3 [Trypoxylus dichotomus]